VEILNGQMLAVANRYAEAFAARNTKAIVAGSDAHTLASLGRTYTQVHSARDRQQFMEGLKGGRGTATGDSGDFTKLTRAVVEIGFEMLKERRWTTLLSPLMAAIPLVTLAHLALETVFAHKWGRARGGRGWHRGTACLVLEEEGTRRGGTARCRPGGFSSEFRKPSYGVAVLLRRRRRGFVLNPRLRKPGRTPRNAGNRPHPAASGTPSVYAHRPAYKVQIIPILVKVGTLSSPFLVLYSVRAGLPKERR
jgi:hypothetical protein